LERNSYTSYHAEATKSKFEVQQNLNKLTTCNFNACYIKSTNKHVMTTTTTTTTTGERWRVKSSLPQTPWSVQHVTLITQPEATNN